MNTPLSARSAILAAVIVVTAFVCWEIYLRHKGVAADFDDGPELWADKRALVYEPAGKTTVFIGSSRIKYDLDIPTWESLTGTHAIQLAMVGSSPRPFFNDLANDPRFKGRVIVDITEVLFFNDAPYVLTSPMEGIGYYKDRTPAQKASFAISSILESKWVFLNKDFCSLNALLDEWHVQDRPGVYPKLDFPQGFGNNQRDRQVKMSDQFLADTNRQNKVKGIWGMLAQMGQRAGPPVHGKALDSIFENARDNVAKIRARGGDVLFVRTPSTGPYLAGENMGYPRSNYWDKLLAVTGCKGVYFSDYPEIAHFDCPEFSHLSPTSAVAYTRGLVNILKTEKGWVF